MVSTEKANLQAPEGLIVSTNDNLVSVKATEAPLKNVIEQIGQRLVIEVEAHIRNKEKVTAEFQDLSLEEAIKRLSGNYAYTTDSDGSNVVKLFVFPKGKVAPPSRSVAVKKENEAGRRASTGEPFKFEFDPG